MSVVVPGLSYQIIGLRISPDRVGKIIISQVIPTYVNLRACLSVDAASLVLLLIMIMIIVIIIIILVFFFLAVVIVAVLLLLFCHLLSFACFSFQDSSIQSFPPIIVSYQLKQTPHSPR